MKVTDVMNRRETLRNWVKENNTPVQELCPEINQYFKNKNGYEIWNSKTGERKAVDYQPNTYSARQIYNLVNLCSVSSFYEGFYVRYIEELDALEMSYIKLDGGRGQNGVAREWKFNTQSFSSECRRFFFFKDDTNVYSDLDEVAMADVGGRYNKTIYQIMNSNWRCLITSKVNREELNKFAGNIEFNTKWCNYDATIWNPGVYKFAEWYKKHFKPKSASKLALKIDEYKLDDIEEFEMETDLPYAIVYQQLDETMAVLRMFAFGSHYDHELRRSARDINSTYREEIGRLYISDKGKPTFMTAEMSNWIIKAKVTWQCGNVAEIINKEEMETWKPLRYILPCMENITFDNICNYLRHPIVEQLYKSGYPKLAKRVNGDCIPSTLKNYFLVEKEKKLPIYKLLGVNKYVLAAAEKYDSLDTVRELKYFYGNFDISNCTEEVAEKIGKYVTQNGGWHNHICDLCPNHVVTWWRRNVDMYHENPLTDEERKWILKLIRLEGKEEGCISAYKDTVNTYNRLNVRPEIDLFNLHSLSDIRRLHDAVVALQIQEETERQARYNEDKKKRLEYAQKQFEKRQKERIEKFEYEDGDWCIRVPHELTEITKEGIMLHHCVGGYLDRHANGETNIIFLRKKSEEDVPFFTIEITNANHVVQIHGSHNRWLGNEPEAVPFMYKYLTQLGATFDTKMLLNKGAGYGMGREFLDESYLLSA